MAKSIKELKNKLEVYLRNSDIVLVCPHLDPDCDAISSAIGVSMIAKKNGKKAYIVMDDDVIKIENGVKTIINELPNSVRIISKSEAIKLSKKSKALLVAVDTNKTNLVPFDEFSDFNAIVVIDHHQTDDKSIDADYSYVDLEVSSTCEIVFYLLNLFNVRLDHRGSVSTEDVTNICNYLLSGIVLDTNKLTKKVSPSTMETVASLMRKGADMSYVNNLFVDDFENDMKVQNLVSKTMWKMFNFGISYNLDDPNFIYNKEDLAKAADWLLKYKGTDASFVLGFIRDGLVYISARSKGQINVGEIMQQLGGGGNMVSAASSVPSEDILEVKSTLEEVIKPGYSFNEKPKTLTLIGPKKPNE